MEIRVGEVGRIVGGKDAGHYVQVLDDKANSGGFLIFIAPTPDMHGGFDSWVEGHEVLRQFFEESEWRVEWLSRAPQ